MKYALTFIVALLFAVAAKAIDLSKATIVYDKNDHALVAKMANTLAEDVERVSGTRPVVRNKCGKGMNIILGTLGNSAFTKGRHADMKGKWETYAIDADVKNVRITGSDPRGLAYGVLSVSESIGVNPWYWFADVPVKTSADGKAEYAVGADYHFVSAEPTIKYRGVFINDEDWGMKTWAERNFEKELGDIGPKTYDKVCELILRLKGNMLAPAMHTCTGAFYSHPESQRKAAEWGIMITTSHCEPLLFNNAAPSEWTKERDGEWNYMTNKKTILEKLDKRISDTRQYDNIYTMGMRGLHDEAMKGSTNPKDRARTLEQVFADQRNILTKYKKKSADCIPQIFVPYKETLDIYDSGLKVPEDITIVWPDDNYGYMKRVSNDAEKTRKGGSGVYYHLSYLGTPHDYLWVSTTAPVLMYEELKKAYDAGADRYWLLNVGDIKPMEIETQMFFDMAWNFSAFDIKRANRYQAEWLGSVFGKEKIEDFQHILDTYYRLAWQRKPEYMGYEIQWDSKVNERLYDSDFSFADGTAQKRLLEYKGIADLCNVIEEGLPQEARAAFFEMLGFSVNAANLMNWKFLAAQWNHETGDVSKREMSEQAYRDIEALLQKYNGLLGGKWNQMMSEVPPGFVSQYQNKPEYVTEPTTAYRLPKSQHYEVMDNVVDLRSIEVTAPFQKVEGIGCDWIALQMGEPFAQVQDASSLQSSHLDIPINLTSQSDSLKVQISVVPFWPVSQERSNRLGVSLDGCPPVVLENKIVEWSYPWKLQVMENRKDYILQFPIDKTRQSHQLRLIIGDPGQMVQKISYK